MEDRNRLIIGFIVGGLLLLGLSFYLSKKPTGISEQRQRLGEVSLDGGQVFLIRNGYLQKEKIEKRTVVYQLDTVETADIGSGIIALDSAYKVKVLDNSSVTFERIEDAEDYHIDLIIKKGDIRILNFGREGQLFIAKNGERISASEYNNSILSQTPAKATPTTEAPNLNNDHGPGEAEITATMNSHRTSFFKCYTQLLQKSPQSKGMVSITFTIENSGKLGVVDVTSAQIQDEDFKKCLLAVMSRIEFKSFAGPAVSTLFPLKFE